MTVLITVLAYIPLLFSYPFDIFLHRNMLVVMTAAALAVSGICWQFLFRFRGYKEIAVTFGKVYGKSINVAMYYTQVQPKDADQMSGLEKVKFSETDYLGISSVLPKNSQEFVDCFPKNIADSQTYTLGAGVDVDKDGVSIGISASTEFEANSLVVEDRSDIDERKFFIGFDYQDISTTMGDFYLRNRSEQKAVFYYLTDGDSFSFPVTIDVTFRLRAIGLFGIEYNYAFAGKTQTFNIALGS